MKKNFLSSYFYCDIHHRRSIRLDGYDYTQAGAYFITICTYERECLFGNVVEGNMQLNDLGRIVADEWVKTADIRPEIGLDAWVVMPNHFHGIVVMINGRGTARRAPTTAATKRINEFRHTPGMPVWQRNYYEHIIRNETSLAKIREYIINNPQQWELDRENPTNIRTD